MNSKLKVLVSVMVMSFVMVGCGGGGGSDGGGSSEPIVDNSSNAENQYGYFGDNVIFGNQKIVGDWTLNQKSTKAYIFMNFDNDGSGNIQDGSGGSLNGDYGVSQDGTLLKGAYSDAHPNANIDLSHRDVEISLLRTLYDYLSVTDVDGTKTIHDCYEIYYKEQKLGGTVEADDIVMCPGG